MKISNYSDLRNNLKGYIDSVIDDSETVVVNRGNGHGVVLISLDEYNALKETEYINSSPVMVERIKEARKEISEGKGKKIKTEDLWK